MRTHSVDLSPGQIVSSPGGRSLVVGDIFVPKNNSAKSHALPAQYRTLSRKVVLFSNGSVAKLRDVQERYRVCEMQDV